MTTTDPVAARPRRPWWVSLLDVGDPIVRAADDPRAWASGAHAHHVPAQRRPPS